MSFVTNAIAVEDEIFERAANTTATIRATDVDSVVQAVFPSQLLSLPSLLTVELNNKPQNEIAEMAGVVCIGRMG